MGRDELDPSCEALCLRRTAGLPGFIRRYAPGSGPIATPHKPAAPTPSRRIRLRAPVEAVVPFRAGEKLSFRVIWSKFSVNAGTVDFLVAQHGNFFGQPAWHFQARAQTVDTMRLVYPLDDQFDSYTEAVKLASLQYEMYLHEQGKQQNDSWRMTVDGSPAPSDATAARVLPGTRDPIGFLYALRATDWKSTPELRAPVFDGHHLYDVDAKLGLAAGHVRCRQASSTPPAWTCGCPSTAKRSTDTSFPCGSRRTRRARRC